MAQLLVVMQMRIEHPKAIADFYALASLALSFSFVSFSAFAKFVSALPFSVSAGLCLFLLPFSVIPVYLLLLPKSQSRRWRLMCIFFVDVCWLFYIAYPVS